MEFLAYSAITLISVSNFFMADALAIDRDCDFYQDMILGQEYYIYNKEYPSYYSTANSCKWIAHSETGTRIVIICEVVNIPLSTSCTGDRLSISLTGNENLSDAKNYCGRGSVSLISNANYLSVGLFSTRNTSGGKFICTLTAILDPSLPTTPPPTQKPDVCECGWKQETRIVGGKETGVNEYPAMAGLVDLLQKEVFCGSSIISNRYVLSAAHCVLNRNTNNIGVLVGDHDISTGKDTPAAVLYSVNDYEVHPQYNLKTNANDIAILQTSIPITFNTKVGPICLPFRYTNFDFAGATVTALGWGQLEFSGPSSDTLQEVNLTVVPIFECAAELLNITSKQLCTYSPGRDACQRDSGGPVVWMDTSTRRLQLIALISYGVGCATDKPGVNTRLTSYLPWIVSRTSDATYCIR